MCELLTLIIRSIKVIRCLLFYEVHLQPNLYTDDHISTYHKLQDVFPGYHSSKFLPSPPPFFFHPISLIIHRITKQVTCMCDSYMTNLYIIMYTLPDIFTDIIYIRQLHVGKILLTYVGSSSISCASINRSHTRMIILQLNGLLDEERRLCWTAKRPLIGTSVYKLFNLID